MYNRYIPDSTHYEQIGEPPSAGKSSGFRKEARRPPPPPFQQGAGALEGIAGRLGGLFKHIHFEELDSGDILLVLILLFLFLESDDNLELVITLGLLLLFGLFGSDGKEGD